MRGPWLACERALTADELVARKARIRDGLMREHDGRPDLSARTRAIDEARALSGMHLADDDIADLVEQLTTYIRDSIEKRWTPTLTQTGGKPDPNPPEDIAAALKALQHLRGASGGRVHVNLGGIRFSRMNLEDLDLTGFYFGHSWFDDANLSNCVCDGADFRHAHFPGSATWGTRRKGDWPANFRNTRFERADLAGSKWAFVDFHGSNIEEATGHESVAVFCDILGLTDEQKALFERASARCPK